MSLRVQGILAALLLGAAATAAAAPAGPVPGTGGVGDLALPLLRMVASLGAVLALVAGCAWVARRLRAGAGLRTGLIEIVSGISLGAREKVVLLRVGSEQVLVGVSPSGMRTLHVMKDETPPFPAHMGSQP
jgi:flagellar protein FliO/FliZ